MYPNLRAEMARKSVTSNDIATALGVRPATISWKLNGKSDFSLAEAKKIKERLGVEMTLDELFEE